MAERKAIVGMNVVITMAGSGRRFSEAGKSTGNGAMRQRSVE